MPDQKVYGLALIVTTTRKLCKALTRFLPTIVPILPAPEAAALLALHEACQDLLAMEPLPGTDNDPGTLA